MTDSYAIVFEKISKTFKHAKEPSVYETNLKIEKGSFVTILGASGCGKTTLLKMVNRLYEPSTGRILVNGEDTANASPTLLRRKMGYVIQQVGLFQHMTVEQNVATVPEVLGWDRQKIDQRVDALLRLVNLPPKEFRKRYPGQLSGGQQQRVGIARAMAADPSILLMDEPFGAIDAINRAALQDEILRIQKKLHKTILFVTHDIMEALKLGDQVIIMNQGKIQQFDAPLAILQHPANSFVRDLVHPEDLLQQMAFIKSRDVMNTDAAVLGADDQTPTAGEEESLKDVLLLLLKTQAEYVLIKNTEGAVVGRISFQELKKVGLNAELH
ncbi:ABC transporter ATP-binding protein [Sporolactobacillus shoreae]|uniref:Carnitine transport ATP-binding protein OpuCA n=1 Tax=Sporolactobacillus shoreae TaxID=1465501 RepID=A0A4Z0GTE9_9BACL|nr:ABC transporter ATP-binding protein [Sporolactobacillus shoreae]TGA99944.1 ABC transporter ATP-binding protein [Sporolactobacillus shoreae]